MKVTFWGVRGSIPAPGPATIRYGGNTACVTLRLQDDALVIFDCGTGARMLGNELMKNSPMGKGQGQALVLLSMSQWDHIQGFPFFRPFYVPGNKFTIFGSSIDPGDLESVLEFQMAAQYFPVQTIQNMAAELVIEALEDNQPVPIGAAQLSGARSQPGIEGEKKSAIAYRIDQGGRSVVYAGHAGYDDRGAGPQTIQLFRDADLLIHECSFTPEDGARYQQRGLASLDQALDAAIAANVKRLALFHYDQDYTDHEIDSLLVRARDEAKQRGSKVDIIAATENTTIEV